jgi:hypothetical protein
VDVASSLPRPVTTWRPCCARCSSCLPLGIKKCGCC